MSFQSRDTNFFSPECLGHGGGDKFHTELTVETFTCRYQDTVIVNGSEYFNGTFNPFATIFFASGGNFKMRTILSDVSVFINVFAFEMYLHYIDSTTL